jgi:hypothetical protein
MAYQSTLLSKKGAKVHKIIKANCNLPSQTILSVKRDFFLIESHIFMQTMIRCRNVTMQIRTRGPFRINSINL